MRTLIAVCVLVVLASIGPALGAESANAKIARALSAAPDSIKAGATIMDMDAYGKATVLRAGSNGFTCFPGHVGVVGDDPVCADHQAMVWMKDYVGHKPKPTNTLPGIAYMLAGGSDWSATDPFATKGTPIHAPPHWMLLWPYNPKSTGLSTKASNTGTWIMFSGTPWAHLMIIQKP